MSKFSLHCNYTIGDYICQYNYTVAFEIDFNKQKLGKAESLLIDGGLKNARNQSFG